MHHGPFGSKGLLTERSVAPAPGPWPSPSAGDARGEACGGLFIAAGLDPVVSWLTRRRVPRGAAVVIVLLALVGVTGGFMAAAIPPLAAQTSSLIAELPHYAHVLQNHNSELGRLNAKYHIQQHLSHLLATRSSALIGGVLGAGTLVLDTPRIMGGAVKVPAVVSVVAVLVGGALLGIIGALVAIPVAAALRLLLEEIMFRRLDGS